SDYRPGMPEVRVSPNRDKLALLNVPVGRVADSMTLLVGGQRVAKYTDRGRRYDVRVRLYNHQRSTPDQLAPLQLRAGPDRLVPVSDVTTQTTVATLPMIPRFNHQRKIEVTASPAPGVSQGQAILACQQIAAAALPSERFQVVELGNASALRETVRSLL